MRQAAHKPKEYTHARTRKHTNARGTPFEINTIHRSFPHVTQSALFGENIAINLKGCLQDSSRVSHSYHTRNAVLATDDDRRSPPIFFVYSDLCICKLARKNKLKAFKKRKEGRGGHTAKAKEERKM